jgi:C1A family cysteine protease
MKIPLLLLLLGVASEASWPSKEGVAVPCGTTFDLNDYEEPDIEFQSIKGDNVACSFYITAPRDYHVELACVGGATANGQDATNFHGEAPVEIVFLPEDEDSQLSCRVGIEEEHEDVGALHGKDGTDTNIKEFEAAFNIHEKNETYRAAILAENEELIREINADRSLTWNAGVTNMADKTIEEVVGLYTGLPPPPSQEEQDIQTEITERELLAPLRARRGSLPASVDLTAIGRVTPAKSQSSCGSCACFSSVSTIESCMHKVTGVLPTDLSEQHLMDCAYKYKGSAGCEGAWPMNYYDWMHNKHNGGLANEKQYPYISADWGMVDRAGECKNVPSASWGAKVTSHYQTWNAKEEDIMQLLAEGHSVSTSFKVEGGFHLYRDGVYQNSKCENWRTGKHSNNRNHAVAIVGYGTLNGVKYWKMKNSWGSTWGTNGFQKILRGVGHCGFAMEISVPICSASGSIVTTPAPKPTPSPKGSCGGTVRGRKGVIISEGYPVKYKMSQDCAWNIQPYNAKSNEVIKFTVKDMDVEYVGKCQYDYVQFKNNENSVISLGAGDAASQGKLCGDVLPTPFFSKGNRASVVFHSDNIEARKGFKIEYELVKAPSCKKQKLSTAVGVQPVIFTTLNYPSGYEVNQECDWTITVPRGQIVNLVFDKFDTEYQYDIVTIYNGPSVNSPILKTMSGLKNRPVQLRSTGNTMLVTFKSDNIETKKGFTASVSAEK